LLVKTNHTNMYMKPSTLFLVSFVFLFMFTCAFNLQAQETKEEYSTQPNKKKKKQEPQNTFKVQKDKISVKSSPDQKVLDVKKVQKVKTTQQNRMKKLKTKKPNYWEPTSNIPLVDFFRNPEKNAYKISPDGTHFSYLAPYKNRMNIHVQKIGSTEVERITNETEQDLTSYSWLNDNRLIYMKDSGGNENFKIFGIDKEGSNLKDLTPFENTDYLKSGKRFQKGFVQMGKEGHAPEKIAKLFLKIVEKKKPKTRYAVLSHPIKEWYLPRILPTRMFDNMLGKQLGLTKIKRD